MITVLLTLCKSAGSAGLLAQQDYNLIFTFWKDTRHKQTVRPVLDIHNVSQIQSLSWSRCGIYRVGIMPRPSDHFYKVFWPDIILVFKIMFEVLKIRILEFCDTSRFRLTFFSKIQLNKKFLSWNFVELMNFLGFILEKANRKILELK